MPQALRHKDVACFAFLRSSLECTVEWQPHGLFFDSRSILLVRMQDVLERLDLNSVLFLFTMLKILSQSALLGYIAKKHLCYFHQCWIQHISSGWRPQLQNFMSLGVDSQVWFQDFISEIFQLVPFILWYKLGELVCKEQPLVELHLCAFGDIQYISILKNFFFKWIGLSHIAACWREVAAYTVVELLQVTLLSVLYDVCACCLANKQLFITFLITFICELYFIHFTMSSNDSGFTNRTSSDISWLHITLCILVVGLLDHSLITSNLRENIIILTLDCKISLRKEGLAKQKDVCLVAGTFQSNMLGGI